MKSILKSISKWLKAAAIIIAAVVVVFGLVILFLLYLAWYHILCWGMRNIVGRFVAVADCVDCGFPWPVRKGKGEEEHLCPRCLQLFLEED